MRIYILHILLAVGIVMILIACFALFLENRRIAVLKQQIGLYIYNPIDRSRHKRIYGIALALILFGSMDFIVLIMISYFLKITLFIG